MRKHSLIQILLTLTITMCSYAQKNVEGGSCSYETTNYPAAIILILEVDSVHTDMFVVINPYGKVDTLSYHSQRGDYFSKKDMTEMNFKSGDTLTYQIKQIKEGHCTPYITRLTKERYKK